MLLDGKVALVAGGGSSIRSAIAERAFAEGATVVVADPRSAVDSPIGSRLSTFPSRRLRVRRPIRRARTRPGCGGRPAPGSRAFSSAAPPFPRRTPTMPPALLAWDVQAAVDAQRLVGPVEGADPDMHDARGHGEAVVSERIHPAPHQFQGPGCSGAKGCRGDLRAVAGHGSVLQVGRGAGGAERSRARRRHARPPGAARGFGAAEGCSRSSFRQSLRRTGHGGCFCLRTTAAP